MMIAVPALDIMLKQGDGLRKCNSECGLSMLYPACDTVRCIVYIVSHITVHNYEPVYMTVLQSAR